MKSNIIIIFLFLVLPMHLLAIVSGKALMITTDAGQNGLGDIYILNEVPQKMDLNISFLDMAENYRIQEVSGHLVLAGKKSIGVFIKYAYFNDTFDVIDSLGLKNGEGSIYDVMAGLSFCLPYRGIIFNPRIKYVMSRIVYYDASSMALDLNSCISWGGDMKLSVSLNNLFSGLKFGAGSSYVVESLPVYLDIGFKKMIQKKFELLAGWCYYVYEGFKLSLGFSYTPFDFIHFRLGYKYLTEVDTVGITTGIGLSWKGFSLDYSLVPYRTFGLLQNVTLRYRI